MYKKLTSALFLLSIGVAVFAQGRVGSPYTRYGIGDITRSTLTRNNSMGGLSYTLPYANGINYANPAAVGEIDSLTFILDFGINGGARLFQISDPEYSQVKSDFHLSHINFGFAVTKWWKAAVGVLPFSDVGYSISSKDTLLNVDKNYLFAGDGGINKVFFTNAFNPFNNLYFGITASYLFGKIYQSNGIVFNDETGAFLNVFEQNTIQIHDFSVDAGLKYVYKINDVNSLSLGAVYGLNSNLGAVRTRIIYHTLSSSSAVVDTVFRADDEDGIISLPQNIGLGLGYQYNDKLYLGFDYTMQSWANAEFFGQTDNLSNSKFMSLGVEYIPSGSRGSIFSYWKGVAYRGGVHYNQNYFKLASGETPINDFGISFGLGLPMKRSKTSFNISLEYGQRGTLDNSLVKENYAILGISFNLAETWFVKSKFD
ncbi:MAG: hypothetical protein PHP52_02665 [Bacteroidales bacterium]|nr:hypothetical protein [Bacteroidales bacterium]